MLIEWLILAAWIGLGLGCLAWWADRRKAKQPQAHILPFLDWVEQMTTEQRMQHLHQRVRNRKRERVVIH